MLDGLRSRLKKVPALASARRRVRDEMSRYRRHAGVLVRGSLIRQYLATSATKRLQLGAGTNLLPGWLNTDAYPSSFRVVSVDARRRLPFDDGTFDFVFTEHQIEHVSYVDGRALLAECARVLKRGGRIRVATPDLDTLLSLRNGTLSAEQEAYVRWATDLFLPGVGEYRGLVVVNNAFRDWGHQFLYDEATLRAALERSGFESVARFPMGESATPDLRGIECHGQAVGNVEMARFETMVLEGVRR